MEKAFVGLGSNLDNPPEQIRRALATIAATISEGEFEVGSWVCSPPLEGGPPQGDYLNTVCSFFSSREPRALLGELRGIEDEQGRKRSVHWGPRTLDLDLLLYGQQTLHSAELTLPHPGIAHREFVLVPILDIDSGLEDPCSRVPYRDILSALIERQPSTLETYRGSH